MDSLHVVLSIVGALLVSLFGILINIIRETKKDQVALKSEQAELREGLGKRITILESTTVKDNDVRDLIEEALRPVDEGIKQISSCISEINIQLHEIQLENAKREAREEALKEH